MNRLMAKKQTNKQTELHQLHKKHSCDSVYLPVNFEFDQTKSFQVIVQKQKMFLTIRTNNVDQRQETPDKVHLEKITTKI